MVPMPPRTLDMVASPGEARAKARHRALPGEYGPAVGGVDRQEGQHAAHLGVLVAVGQVVVDHVHHAAEQGGADGLALLLVGRARPHLVERPGRLAHVEPADGPGRRLGPSRHLGHAQHGLDAQGLVEVLQEPVGVAVEQDRRLARRPDAGRLHLGLVDRAGGEAQVVEDLVGDGELDGAGQLEAVAAGQLGGGGHAADEVVLLQAQDPHPAPGHDGRRGEPVVARTDDDGVVVRHRGSR